ncbi:MAG: alpha-D-ribose 1-methylphosphonate 5-triphosphate diphosphatase [Chloroflexi bacterium]|nr:alpha-D-ribose 1-methylphosphonate 5-triphosphate diphosphatase [Chloroflexota bacterium]
MTGRIILTNARVVTGDRVLEGGSVVVTGEWIEAVEPATVAAGPGIVDLGGRWLLPGLVDLHDDVLEMEINPRPRAEFDPVLALLSLDRRLAAAGVTTQYHGVSFAEQPAIGRTLAGARAVCAAVHALRASDVACVEHHVLHRLEVRTPGALAALLAALPAEPAPLVSVDDHAPGRGKMADPAIFRAYLRRYLPRETTDDELEEHVARVQAETAATEPLVIESLTRLTALRAESGLTLASHDDDSAERVEALHAAGCRICEFPLAAEAAVRARALGMTIVMGAPNVVRGGSLTGRNGALAMLSDNLLDILVADYHPPSLLAAVFRIVALGLRDLPAAVRLVASAPAVAAGLPDRGRLAPGLRADLVAVEVRGDWPVVAATWLAGVRRYAAGAAAAAAFG